RKIAPHAVEAWKVRDGEGALVLVVEPPKGAAGKHYMLRYYDLGSGRRRDLGEVPISKATLKETEDKEELWAFALSGMDLKTHAQVVMVGDDQAIPGLIEGAAQPAFEQDVLRYQTASGESREAKVGVLLGTTLGEIYAPPQGGQAAPQLLQVFPDESAMEVMPDGKIVKGSWHTDGQTLTLDCGSTLYSV